MDKEMLKFIEIRNSYVRPKIGELSINEKALAEYEKFCLDLIKQLKKKDEVIEKIKITLKEQAIKIPTRIDDMTCEMKYTDEVVKVNELLQILEDKEVK